MQIVTVSPKYQVVIPRAIRDELGIKPGQKVQVIAYQNRVEILPLVSAKQMRGFLKGIHTDIERDADRL